MDSPRETGSPPPTEIPTTIGNIGKAIALSLMVFPGLGHRFFGRTLAYRIILVSFLLTFIYFGVNVHSMVQEEVSKIQAKDGIDLLPFATGLLENLNQRQEIVRAFRLLLAIYFGAPAELVLSIIIAKNRSPRS